jgi:hypothetical protein
MGSRFKGTSARSPFTPSCPYCGAWYPFDNRPLWIVLGVIAALSAIYAVVKLTSL